MKYILRVVIHENAWERQMEDIVALCHYASIEEVFLKEQCHQILMSPFPLEKHKRMVEIYKKIGVRLKKEGIHFSINLATVIGHCDAKLSKELILPYTKFVGESLQPNYSTYCILDERWQNFVQEMVCLYAQSEPEIMMIDDDFRSLNHSGYLGCFCPIHVERTEKECGIPLTAEKLREHVLGNSETDRKVRAAWQKINFEGQLKAARAIEKAVHTISPSIRVGLMNSGEPNHSVQGRDMDLLLKAFAGNKQPVSRPVGGAYEDCLHAELVKMHHGMALSEAQLDNAEIISEVENWPHTRYTKSVSMTKLQMKLHALAGADRISMNIFDFMGTPYAQEPRFAKMIRDTKPDLEKIKTLRCGKKLAGIGMLWDKQYAQNQYNSTHTAEDLIPHREADALFTLLGIPVAFCRQPVNFLTASVAQNMSDDEIRELLSGGLLLDASGFQCLSQRGFGQYLGCRSEKILQEVSTEIFVDKEFCGDFTNNMLPTDWMRLGLKDIQIPLLIPSQGARVLTEILDVEYHRIGYGVCICENELGGRVAVLPGHISTWTYAYRSRAYLMRNIVRYLYRGKFPFFMQDGVNIAPFYYENEQEGLLALVNTGLDEEKVTIETTYKLKEKGDTVDNIFTVRPLEFRLLTVCKYEESL